MTRFWKSKATSFACLVALAMAACNSPKKSTTTGADTTTLGGGSGDGSGSGDGGSGGGGDGGSGSGSGGGDGGSGGGGGGGSGSETALFGTPCQDDSQCGTSQDVYCITTMPNGYCLKLYCESDADCSPNGKCLDVGGGTTACVVGCTADTECRKDEGYYCEPEGGFCISSQYVPTNPGKAAVGAACASDDDCEGGYCLTA
ncbi:MAG: hypothetical protein RL199_1290, partial [Pseudomonadota bacterium]